MVVCSLPFPLCLPSLPCSLSPHVQHKVDHYVFVSSAGAYKADPIEPMHVEGDARKSTAGGYTLGSARDWGPVGVVW